MKRLFPYCILILSLACKQEDLPTSNLMFDAETPSYISTPSILNNVPMKGIQLGERLFNDVNLSSNKLVSCGTCHLQEYPYGENVNLSTAGVSGEQVVRHTPALFNLAWQKTYFWDGGAFDLESQALAPLFSEHEMNSNFDSILTYLKDSDSYQEQFCEVFTNGEINSSNFLLAIRWFESTLISFNSKYDKFYSQKDSSILSPSEIEGLKIYEAQCNSCHTLPLGSDYDFKNNGLDQTFDYPIEDERLGRNRITNDIEDLGKYKTPSLRNLSFTSPYMHDGRFSSLEEVLTHYENLASSEHISVTLQKGHVEDLKSFLYTLNDTSFVKN